MGTIDSALATEPLTGKPGAGCNLKGLDTCGIVAAFSCMKEPPSKQGFPVGWLVRPDGQRTQRQNQRMKNGWRRLTGRQFSHRLGGCRHDREGS
jgi:hypothetical protein